MKDDHFIIMNARCLFDNGKTTVNGVVGVWGGKQTILVCRRAYGSDNAQKIFVSGAGLGYIPKGEQLPILASYTEDTGSGYRHSNKPLLIDNVIEVVGGVFKPRNMVGINEKRIAWTMK